jgi:uncharacterized protein with FMN-binding domain
MRRAPIVITATVVGTAGVLLFKPLPVSSLAGTGASGSDSSAPSTSSAGSSATSSEAPSSTGSAGATPSGSSSKTALSATAKGALETDRYGNTQVEVTISNGRITAVTVLAYNDGDPRSAEISQQAMPLLRQEVLSKQTAAVDAVSGATYTSNAYEASLQSALDKAGYRAPDGSKATTARCSAARAPQPRT